MTDLSRIVEDMEADARLPRPIIEAHKQTLAALVAMARRLEALEAKAAKK